MTSHKDYYAVLEISPQASPRAVSEAYDRLSRRYQPDEDAPPADPERMSEIDEAFDTLDDPQRRAEYDRQRAPPSAAAVAVSEAITAAKPRSRREWLAFGLIGVGSLVAIAGLVALTILLLPSDDRTKVILARGLIYSELREGAGGPPHPGDALTVHYTGKLEDGTEFASSRDSDPIVFVLGAGDVIPGWEEGFASMEEGGKRRLTIPPGLAFGPEGQGEIPPDATLIFDVELLQIEATGQEVTTDSGLKYVDREIGRDPQSFDAITPEDGDEVAVHYTGELEDGTKFAGTLAGGEPYTFVLGEAEIEGLNEGVSTMKMGGSRRLVVPPKLGYGDEGGEVTFGDETVAIPPDGTLIFEVTLVGVK